MIFHIEPGIAPPVKLRGAAKRHLVDPSLAVAALGAGENSLVQDRKTFWIIA